MMVDIMQGSAHSLPTPTSQGKYFHHDGMYARKWPLPLCVYSVAVSSTQRYSYRLIDWRSFQDDKILPCSLEVGQGPNPILLNSWHVLHFFRAIPDSITVFHFTLHALECCLCVLSPKHKSSVAKLHRLAGWYDNPICILGSFPIASSGI
jgi:hypothetical protein